MPRSGVTEESLGDADPVGGPHRTVTAVITTVTVWVFKTLQQSCLWVIMGDEPQKLSVSISSILPLPDLS